MSTTTKPARILLADDRRVPPSIGGIYPSRGEAAEALRRYMGWGTIALTHNYAVGDGDTYAVSAYATAEERDADHDGAFAARIVDVAGRPS